MPRSRPTRCASPTTATGPTPGCRSAMGASSSTRCGHRAEGEEITVNYGETHHGARWPAAVAHLVHRLAVTRAHRPCAREAPRGPADNRPMNPLLATLHPYPFERLRELTRGLTPIRPIARSAWASASPPPGAGIGARGAGGQLPGLVGLPRPPQATRNCARPSPAGWGVATAWRWTRRRRCCRCAARARPCSRWRRR